MGAIGQDHRIVEGSASPGSAATDDIVPTPPSPCLNEIGDDDATPRQQWSPVHKLVRARTQPSADYGSVSAGLRSSGDEHCKREMIGRTCSAGERPTHKRNASHTQGCHARPDSPVMHVDIDCLDLSGLALRDESSQTGVGQVEPLTTGSVGYHSVAFGRPRSLGGRPSRSPALFVAPGHIGTGPSSPPSSYSTHSESGFGSPARRLASPAPTREVGRVRKGHWKKGKAIGVGSCGNVYLGMNEDTGELMAVKEITLEAKEKLLCSLYNEIQVMHKLVHPHIVGYLGAELQDSQRKLCIFQEWVPAGSLHSLLDQFGALSEAMTRKYTGQVLEGLTYLHANRVIHRDVKSKNILVDDRGNVKLADFGCALVLKDDNNGDGVEMSMKGTPLFMAPEMLLKRKCGRRVDVWSLGCAVLEMVTTRPPWAETFKHPIEIIEHFNKNPGPPPLPADLPIMLRRFLLLCFTWDPEMRPSAQELIAHPYLQQRSSAGDVDATNPSDDVPLEEMDRVSAVTRMRRCSSATLDLLAVQARQASIGVGIGGGIGAYGSGHSGSCRPPSPRYATGALANKRTPTRRRKFGVSEGTTAPLVPTEGIVPALGKVPRGQSDSSVTAAAPPGVSAAPTPGSVSSADDRPRRNSLPLTRSPPLSPEKPGEGERPRTNESRRPGRGAGVSGHFGQSEDEGRISGPILPRRLRGHVGDRSSSAGSSSIRSFVSNESVMVEAGSAALPDSSAVGTLGPASGGFRRIPTPLSTPREHEAPGDGDNRALVQGSAGVGAPVIPATTVSIPTPLSTPREHELLGVTLVGGCGTIVDLGPVSDTPPPTVRPLEIRPSVRVLDASWVPAPGGSADKVLPESRSGLKVMWGPAAPEADARGDMGPCH